MKELELKLSLDEVNLILASLSKQSFEAVSGLIFKIREQGQSQIIAETKVEKKEKSKKAE